VTYKPFADDQLQEMDAQFGAIHVNDAKAKARAPKNLAMATIVGVSVDGVQTVHTAGTTASDPTARKAPREALAALMARPGNVGIGEAVADALAELNGIVGDATEKG
jgi:hypothetical protein